MLWSYFFYEGGLSKKCQNGACYLDLDVENDVKVHRSWHFSWPHLRYFLTQNQNVSCSEHALPMSLKSANDRREFDLLTLCFEKMRNCKHVGYSLKADMLCWYLRLTYFQSHRLASIWDNINGWFWFLSLDSGSLKMLIGTCDLDIDLENETKVNTGQAAVPMAFDPHTMIFATRRAGSTLSSGGIVCRSWYGIPFLVFFCANWHTKYETDGSDEDGSFVFCPIWFAVLQAPDGGCQEGISQTAGSIPCQSDISIVRRQRRSRYQQRHIQGHQRRCIITSSSLLVLFMRRKY